METMTYDERIQVIDEQIGYFEALRDETDDRIKRIIQRLQNERKHLEIMRTTTDAITIANRSNQLFEDTLRGLK